ncbi:MAG: hypothetical protein R3E96_16180 [Planctomycetota bacterium]
MAIDDDAVLERKKLDGDGAFRFADLIPGRYRVVLGPGVYVMAKEVWVQPGRETRVQWIVSERRIDVPIVVLQTDSGQPVARAELALYYHALGVPRELEGEADWRGETDAQGRARVPVAASAQQPAHHGPVGHAHRFGIPRRERLDRTSGTHVCARSAGRARAPGRGGGSRTIRLRPTQRCGTGSWGRVDR